MFGYLPAIGLRLAYFSPFGIHVCVCIYIYVFLGVAPLLVKTISPEVGHTVVDLECGLPIIVIIVKGVLSHLLLNLE